MHHHVPWVLERILVGFVFTVLLCGLRARLRTPRENQRLALADGSTVVCRLRIGTAFANQLGGHYRV